MLSINSISWGQCRAIPMPPLIGAVREQFSRDNRWMLAYFDDYWLLYLRQGGSNQAALDSWGY